MCLIIYSKTGSLPHQRDFYEAAKDNPDGIGVMSADGISKFLGKKATKKAWKYVRKLAAASLPYGVHFRWATHGKVNTKNAHPFRVPETGDYVMHNGVLWTAKLATDEASDTRIFVQEYMQHFGPRTGNWRAEVLASIGYGNKLLVMSDCGREFDIVNESAGEWLDGIWYSNTYSIVSTNAYSYLTRAASFTSNAYASATEEEDDEYQVIQDAADSGEIDGTTAELMFAELDRKLDQQAVLAADRAYWRDEMYRHSTVTRALESDIKAIPWRKQRTGFDWHNSETWTKYPIPGSTVARVGDNENPEDMADGFQEYI